MTHKQLDAAPGQIVCIGEFEVSWNEEREHLLVRLQPGTAPDANGYDARIGLELLSDSDEVAIKVVR